MAKPTPWKDQYTLLCENCGYILEGLDQSLPCPECGVPIADSLPHHNAGSPWQQRRTLINLIKTWFLTLFRSKRLSRQLNIDKDTAISLTWVGLFTGFAIPVLGMMTIIIIAVIQYEFYPQSLNYIMVVAIVMFICWLIAVIYATLGALRLRYYAHRRGFRLSQSSRWTIAGHASLGLTVAPVGITAAVMIGGIMSLLNVDDTYLIVRIILIASAIIGWLAIPIALLEFEILLHIGSRALRYRNIFPESDLDNEPPQHKDPLSPTDIPASP